MKKEYKIIIVVQIACALAVILFVQYSISKITTTSENSVTNMNQFNSIQAKLSQMQMDMFEIKNKLNLR